MARYGQNALEVIHNLKAKIAEIAAGLPEGVTIEAVYDRSDLIHRAIDTLKRTLLEESVIVALVCVVFLMHVRSALVAILMLPVGVLIAFIAMRLLGMNSNIMSLGGIAIAIGAMVDAAIVMIENAHKHLERLKPDHSTRERADAMLAACKEVGPALFFSLLIITVSFLPVFTLEVAGRAAVLAAGLHQDLLHGRRGAAVGHAGAGADDAVHPRQDHAGGEEPAEPLPDLGLSPDHRRRDALEEAHHRAGPGRHGGVVLPGFQAGQRIHADPQRRHAALHAGLAARHVDHQGRRAAADAGQDHQELPRSRPRSTARPAAPTPPPTRRRPRCSRP